MLALTSKLVQGPLAGYSCAPFRELVWRFSNPAFCTTEMISAKDLVHTRRRPKRFLWKSPLEGPLCYQLSGTTPGEIAIATQIVTDAGADFVDLNCGCPMPKIRKKKAGSSLLSDPIKLSSLITAMKSTTHLPVSVKIRIDGNSNDQNNEIIGRAVEEAGADFIVVHGRHWSEDYDVPCHLDQITSLVEQLSIPVIANGDVSDPASLKNMLNTTKCHAVMVSRAGVGQPWLLGELEAAMNNQTFSKPSIPEIGSLLIEHVKALATLESEKSAVLQSRKLAKYYARDLIDKEAFIPQFNACLSLEAIESTVNAFFNGQ